MIAVLCLTEQTHLPAIGVLRAVAAVTPRPLAEFVRDGWEQPLVVLGDALNGPDARALVTRAYRAAAPLLIFPPLPAGDLTAILDAPAPVTVCSHRVESIDLVGQPFLAAREQAGKPAPQFRIYCAQAIETALRANVLATAEGKPVIWAYQPTRAATPVVCVTAQLLLVSARSDPLARQAVLTGLLDWAATHARETTPAAVAAASPVDSALLRAIVVAWAACPTLTATDLPAWLRDRLLLEVTPPMLAAVLAELRQLEAIDVESRPQQERLADLVQMWGLRAWVREAKREC